MADVTSTLADKPLYMEAAPADTDIVHSAAEFRRLIHAVFNTPGPVEYSHFRMRQRTAGANWSMDFDPGLCVVPALNAYEKYLVYLPSVLNVVLTTLNTAPVSTRTHKVFVAVYDKFFAGASYSAAIFVGEDTGSGAPNPTGSPVGYHQLGTFAISPAQVSIADANIQNTFTNAGYDPPWTNLTLSAGYVAGDALRPPAWRRRGKMVELRGQIRKSVGPIPQGGSLFSVPFHMRPNSEARGPVMYSNGADGLVRCGYGIVFDASSGGDFRCWYSPGPSGTSPDEMSLDMFTYDVD